MISEHETLPLNKLVHTIRKKKKQKGLSFNYVLA